MKGGSGGGGGVGVRQEGGEVPFIIIKMKFNVQMEVWGGGEMLMDDSSAIYLSAGFVNLWSEGQMLMFQGDRKTCNDGAGNSTQEMI